VLLTSPNIVPVTQTSGTQITWSTETSWGGRSNNPGSDDAYYLDPTLSPFIDPFSIGNGYLGITTAPLATPITPPDGTPRHWGSGVLTGPPITYGYFEVNEKIPAVSGMWPAFWLYHNNNTASSRIPPYTAPEYDIYEWFGASSLNGGNYVGQTDQLAPNGSQYVHVDNATFGSAYHTYGLLWTSSGVTFYIDREARSQVLPNTTTGSMSAMMVIQVGTGTNGRSSYLGNPVLTPETLYTTYYRAWQSMAKSCRPNTISPMLAKAGQI
jgi:beta-glucanase (GH16 family)